MGITSLSLEQVEQIIERRITPFEQRINILEKKIEGIDKKLNAIISLLSRTNFDHKGQFEDLERIIRNTEASDTPF